MIQTAQLPVPEWIWSIESVFEFLAMADELIARPIDTDDAVAEYDFEAEERQRLEDSAELRIVIKEIAGEG